MTRGADVAGPGEGTASPLSSRGLTTAFLPRDAVTAEFVAAWRDLASRAAEPNPFAGPDVVLPSLEHLSDGRRAGVLAVSGGGRLRALLPVAWPLTVPLRGVRVPTPVMQATVEPYRPLGTPLVDADDPVTAVDGLLRPPPSLPAAALLIRTFADDGPVAAALDEALRRRGLEAVRLKTYQRATLVRDGGPPPNKNRTKRYKRLRRHREQMEHDLGPVAVRDRSADPAAVDQFLVMEASGWKGRSGTALASDPAHATWFRQVCEGLRGRGALEILSLEADGRPVAMACNFLAGDGALHLKSAYDEAVADHRPGDQLAGYFVEAMGPERIAWRDSCTVPDNALFNELWPRRRTLSTVVVPLHGRVGSAALAAARRTWTLRTKAADWRTSFPSAPHQAAVS
jgi:CelD/BcsL family acetyltransferase involved in cellulose biosynthesis